MTDDDKDRQAPLWELLVEGRDGEPDNSNGDYSAVEGVYARFKMGVSAVRTEIETAIRELIYDYSTSNRENRFVVGGAVEYILAAAMRSTGIPVTALGHASDGADLAAYAKALRSNFSVKSTFSKSSGSILLVNFRGGSGDWRQWTEPTIFIAPKLGIVLGHPGHVGLSAAVKRKRDALELPLKALREHASARPDLRIEIEIPMNPKSGTRVASRDVASAILSRPHYPRLGAAVEQSDQMGRLAQLVAMLEKGQVTPHEFDHLKKGILRSSG